MSTSSKLNELMLKKEELHPDLVEYVQPSTFGFGLFHPIIYQIFYSKEMNALINSQYLAKKEMVNSAKEKKDWSSFLFFHERPYRLHAFIEIKDELSDKEYWETLSNIFVDSENIWQNFETWKKLLSSKRKNRHLFMDEKDQAFFKALPEKVTIYRGCISGLNEDGLSYSLSKEKAKWFANRFGSNGIVKKKIISKKEIFAYKSSRNEEEIIIIPRIKVK